MTAIAIRFNDVEEFLDEVRRAPPTDGVVRITNRVTPTRISPTVRHVEVVATYVTAGGTRLIEFVQYVGDLWGIEGAGDEKVLAATDKIRATLESGIAAAELEIRSGICTIAGPSSFPSASDFSEALHLVRAHFQHLRRTLAHEGEGPGRADAAEHLDRAIANLETAEVCAPSTILGRIDATLREHDEVLRRIFDHLVVVEGKLAGEVTP